MRKTMGTREAITSDVMGPIVAWVVFRMRMTKAQWPKTGPVCRVLFSE